MDIKLNLNGSTELINGDFATIDGIEEITMNINRIMRGWYGSFNIMKYAGARNSRSTADNIKSDINLHIRKMYPFLNTRVVPVDKDAILIIIGIPATDSNIYHSIFNYTDGIIKPIGDKEVAVKYKYGENSYI